MLTAREEAAMKAEHFRKYDELAHWLGLDAVKQLVPFPAERIRTALTNGDEHLNTLPLPIWDNVDGQFTPHWKHKGLVARPVPSPTMRVLVRRAIHRDRAREAQPLCTAWSLSDTVCVLKHVARHYVAKEG